MPFWFYHSCTSCLVVTAKKNFGKNQRVCHINWNMDLTSPLAMRTICLLFCYKQYATLGINALIYYYIMPVSLLYYNWLIGIIDNSPFIFLTLDTLWISRTNNLSCLIYIDRSHRGRKIQACSRCTQFAKFVYVPNGYNINNFPATVQNKQTNYNFPFEFYGVFERVQTVLFL